MRKCSKILVRKRQFQFKDSPSDVKVPLGAEEAHVHLHLGVQVAHAHLNSVDVVNFQG